MEIYIKIRDIKSILHEYDPVIVKKYIYIR